LFWEDLQDLLVEEDETPQSAATSPEAPSNKLFEAGAFFSALLKQLYIDQQYVPRTIYVPVDFADRGPLAALLAERSGHRVEIAVPLRGEKRSLVDLRSTRE